MRSSKVNHTKAFSIFLSTIQQKFPRKWCESFQARALPNGGKQGIYQQILTGIDCT